MTKIYEDDQGIYAKVGGWVARPQNPTLFKKSDTAEGKHFSGSTMIGMGKIPGRAKYKEYWHTAGWYSTKEK